MFGGPYCAACSGHVAVHDYGCPNEDDLERRLTYLADRVDSLERRVQDLEEK